MVVYLCLSLVAIELNKSRLLINITPIRQGYCPLVLVKINEYRVAHRDVSNEVLSGTKNRCSQGCE